MSARLSTAGRPWLAAGVEVLAAGALPLALWGSYELVRGLTESEHPAFVLAGILIVAWARLAVAIAAVRELTLRPLLPVPPEHGRYLYGYGRWLLLYGLLGSAMLDAAATWRLPADVLALLRSLFTLSLILLVTAFLARKRAVLALFPNAPNRLYRRFVHGLGRAYTLVLALTAGTSVLAWAGYERLANSVWIRSWALVGLFLAAVLLHHLLRRLLQRWIFADPFPDAHAERFYRSADRLLGYVGGLAVGLAALHLTGLRAPLRRFLGAPIYALAERPISLLMLIEAAAIVAAFVFLARLLRAYLNFQVYPRMHVEEGIADAINTFLGYTLVIVGVLSALEFVGLGLRSVAVFAGAFGIGIGLGLQSTANNLLSGLTLVFGRALRKGDWVTVGDTIGAVEEVGIRATQLRTRDSIEYLVPNAVVVGNTIVNWTRSSPLVRQHIPVSVPYGIDPEAIRALLLEVAAETKHVQPAPPPDVWFVGLGAASLDFELLVWMNLKEVSAQQLRSDLYFAIFRAFKQAGIEVRRAAS